MMPIRPSRFLLFCVALLLAVAAPEGAGAQGAVARTDGHVADASDAAARAFEHATRSGILPVPVGVSFMLGEERTPSEDEVSYSRAGVQQRMMFGRPRSTTMAGGEGGSFSRLSLYCVRRC